MRDNYNNTILHVACSGGSLQVVQYLVEEVKCDVGESVLASVPGSLRCVVIDSLRQYIIARSLRTQGAW